jgi:hypothetical protein
MRVRDQTCEACGATFGCGAEAGGCWCNDVKLDAATLARLRATHERCLCPACLRALAAAAAPAAG